MRRLGAVAVAVALLVTGCTAPEEETLDVVVSGEPGERPTITYRTPLDVDETVSTVIWPGSGPELVEGRPALVDFWLEDATDATVVKESYSTNPTARILSAEDLGEDLYETLRGQRVGARLLQVSPAPGNGATDFPTVTVLDVLPTRAAGEAMTPREGLPMVALADDGSPSITPSAAEPPAELVTQQLMRGTGKQVAEGDVITVQYTGFSWTTGAPFESTWTSGSPVWFSLDSVPAWSALVEQPVGSQVMLVVPPSYPLGVTQSEELQGQTVVFVIDLLASRAATTPEGAAPDATAPAGDGTEPTTEG